MAEIWLLCEGVTDVPVLTEILTTVLASDIIVEPVGGSANAASAAAYLANSARGKRGTVAFVVDRDYHPRHVADASFGDGRRRFMWRRHAIESYLLVPAVVAAAIRSFQSSLAKVPGGGPAWVAALPVDQAVLAEGLRSCAAARAPQEAGRIAMFKLWESLSDTAGEIQKRITGALRSASPDAAVCRGALLDEAARLVAKAHEMAASPHLSPASVGALYDGELARVSAPGYLASLAFLEELNGKDLLAAFLGWLRQAHQARLSADQFLDELVKAVPGAYRANRQIFGTDDFLDLANGVRALAKLPPIV
jgi:hypothetical protein